MERFEDTFSDRTPQGIEVRDHLAELRASISVEDLNLREEPVEFPPRPYELPLVSGIENLMRSKFDLVAKASLTHLEAEFVSPLDSDDETPYVVALGQIKSSIEAFRTRTLVITNLSSSVATLYQVSDLKGLERRAIALLVDHYVWEYGRRAWRLFIDHEIALAQRDLNWRRARGALLVEGRLSSQHMPVSTVENWAAQRLK